MKTSERLENSRVDNNRLSRVITTVTLVMLDGSFESALKEIISVQTSLNETGQISKVHRVATSLRSVKSTPKTHRFCDADDVTLLFMLCVKTPW